MGSIPALTRPLTALLTIASSVWAGCSAVPPAVCAAQARPSQISIRPNGSLAIDRRPFFPMGFYHVSWGISSARQIRHLEDIAAAGFNTVHVSANDWASHAKLLQRAHRLGVYVVSEHHLDPLEFVRRFKNEPAVLAWNLADDVDNGKRTPLEVMALNRKIRAADPNHLTYISGYSKDLQKFARCADILGRQSYPIRNHTTDELSKTHSEIAEIAEITATAPQQALFANLQTFPWEVAGPPERGTVPDTLEVRNMTYQALLGGAKGILYYTYYDEAWFLPDRPQLWQGLKALNREVQSLSPFFLDGTFEPLTFSSKPLKGGIWTKGEKSLWAIANTSVDRSQQALVREKQGRAIAPLFGSPMVQQNAGGTVVLTLPPKAVYLYQIQ
ncbi:hypothetical protein [Altericista sp. CCNU0014]|uniref:hypothetical protein n=1 Tax=Altericista sp. CCNU0014 TaxID=3082949 RepID=UPI00384E8A4D